MSAQYAGISGFVQFDPKTRDFSGQTLVEFMVRGVGFTGQPLVKVTLWPELQADAASVVKGAFVAVEGKYTSNVAGDKTYHNLSATNVVILSATERSEDSRTVANPVAAESTEAPF